LPDTFTLEQRNDRPWLVGPDGKLLFSIGLNHFDPTPLMRAERIDAWRSRFGGSRLRWISEQVGPDLREWGFNTIGYAIDIAVRRKRMIRNARDWTADEFRAAGLPYCPTLPFFNIHWQDIETPYADLFSPAFEEWCDYVARSRCAALADDRNLLGYFYADCPTWTFARNAAMKPAFFDPARLETEDGRAELHRLATRYYQVAHDAVRRYDRHHLIFGDRYNGRLHTADEVLLAAKPYVDVLSFQYFAEPQVIAMDLQRWHELTGLPVLLADATPVKNDPGEYAAMLQAMFDLPCCVGWHVCGGYQANPVRKHGYRDEAGEVNTAMVDAACEANHAVLQAVAAQSV